MKVCFFVLILSGMATYSVFAQTHAQTQSSREISDPLKEYHRNQLSVSSVMPFNSTSFGNQWTPYQGFSKITESKFYELAGFAKESQAARKYAITRTSLLLTGAIGGSLGIAGIVTGTFIKDRGITTFASSMVTIGFAIPFFMGLLMNRWSIVEVAQGVADDYNNQLRNSLGIQR